MYADDTNIFIQGKDLKKMEKDLNTEIKKLSLWFKTNKLSPNIKKTCTMTFSNTPSVRNRPNDIYIDGIEIDTVNHTQFLGVIIDNKINWSDHIKYICNKISKSIGIIKKVTSKLNKKTLVNLYYAFIYPYITYCNVHCCWGRAPTTYLSKIHILQKRIIRIISHVGFRNHTQFLFKTSNYENLSTK